jgi:hypothetical protein
MDKLIDWLDNHFYTVSTALVIFVTTCLYFIVGISR